MLAASSGVRPPSSTASSTRSVAWRMLISRTASSRSWDSAASRTRAASFSVTRPASSIFSTRCRTRSRLKSIPSHFIETLCRCQIICLQGDDVRILGAVPTLWNDTIEAHRQAVRDATLDTTAALVAEHGLSAVTMSQIAEEAGIGRATLYKYFPDVDAILAAWHERQVTGHLQQLAEARGQGGDPSERLSAVLETYALIHYDLRVAHGTEIAALLHRRDHVVRAQQHLRGFVRDLLSEAARAGAVRDDVSADELATYCLHALTAAYVLPSKAAVRRLVAVTMAGLAPGAADLNEHSTGGF